MRAQGSDTVSDPCLSLRDGGTLDAMRVLVVDNYDSFTYNLVHLLEELGAEVVVRQSDSIAVTEARALRADGLVVSPGPGRPSDAGNSIELVRELGATTPTLGVCLGHQAIVEGFGGRIAQARSLIHGKASTISHDGRGIYAGLPSRDRCRALPLARRSRRSRSARGDGADGRRGGHGRSPPRAADRGRPVPSRERPDADRPRDVAHVPRLPPPAS